eukprot:scaffold912_cov119-Cylindrotheca_fusiformis.AAC.5
MVKVNESWETRAFEAAERRRATKQRKEEKNKKRSQKQHAQHLLALLDQFGDQLLMATNGNSSLEIHLWTDFMPSDYFEDVDQLADSAWTPPRKGHARSSSFVTPPSTPQVVKNNRRPRSNSTASPPCTPQSGNRTYRKSEFSNGKRNGNRPRSSSSVSDRSEEDTGLMVLCSGHFFCGSCSGTERKLKKKGRNGCIHGIHMGEGKKHLSLHQSLLNWSEAKSTAAVEALEASKQAAEANRENDPFADVDQIDALYHIPVLLGENAKRLSECVTSTLVKNDCPIASIVYLVMDGMLIFDRYRDGVVLSANDEETLLGEYKGSGIKRRAVSIGEANEAVVGGSTDPSILEYHNHLVQHLPSQVLEYIVLFLSDSMVASMALVCKSWSSEIGKSSPDLWKKLLYRRNWPEIDQCRHSQCFPDNGECGLSTERDDYRNMFISHYTAVRNLNAVVVGLESLESGAQGSVPILSHRDLAMLQIKDSHGHYKSGETIMRIFSGACVLVGNVGDCTLNLFDAAGTIGGSYRRCRRRLAVSVVPFSNSKKMKPKLVAMDLDERIIGCLFAVGRDDDRRQWLGLVNRQDFLCTAGRGGYVSELEEGALRLFDLQAKLMDCLLSCDDDEVVGWIYSHLMSEDEIDLSSVEVDVKGSIVACGNGQFLLEAAIVLPLAFDEESDDLDLMSSALLKVFLFDADRGEIVWVGPTGISGASTMQFWYPLKTSIVANNSGRSQFDGSPAYTEVAFVSRVSADLATLSVGDQGDVACIKLGKGAIAEPLAHEYGTWRRNPEYGRVAVATSSDIVLAECYNQVDRDGSSCHQKTVISFHPTGSSAQTSSNQLTVEGNCLKFPMEPLRGGHILAFSCFEAPENAVGEKSVFALLIDVPSRCVIHRTCIDDSCDFLADCTSFCIASRNHSVAVASKYGLLLVGQDVKSFADSTVERSSSDQKSQQKKKKKAGKRREAKKDVFARGMRQTLG